MKNAIDSAKEAAKRTKAALDKVELVTEPVVDSWLKRLIESHHSALLIIVVGLCVAGLILLAM